MNNLFKYVPVLLALLFASCNGSSQTKDQIANDLEAADFKNKIETLTNEQVLDVRTPEEWDNGTIPAALKMNFYDKNFEEQIAQLGKSLPVLVYCASGGRSKSNEEIKRTGLYRNL